MKLRNIIAALTAFSMLSLPSCGGTASDFKPTKADKAAILTVKSDDGKETVQFQEFRYFFMNNKNDLYGASAELDEEQTAKLRELTENNIKKFHTVNLAAKKHGVKLDDENKKTVAEYTEGFRRDNGLEDDEYKLLLEQYFTTDYFFERLYENKLLSVALMDSLKEQGAIKSDAVAVNKALENGEILCAKEIYVSYASEETKEVAASRAAEALGKLTSGESFEAVMAEYSDYSAESLSPKHGYYTMEYDALDVVWNALNDLAEGEYSVVLESDYGYHIVLRAPIDYEYVEDNFETVAASYENAKFSEYLFGYMDTLTLTYTEKGAELDLSAMS